MARPEDDGPRELPQQALTSEQPVPAVVQERLAQPWCGIGVRGDDT
jgi:hypothetical protein